SQFLRFSVLFRNRDGAGRIQYRRGNSPIRPLLFEEYTRESQIRRARDLNVALRAANNRNRTVEPLDETRLVGTVVFVRTCLLKRLAKDFDLENLWRLRQDQMFPSDSHLDLVPLYLFNSINDRYRENCSAAVIRFRNDGFDFRYGDTRTNRIVYGD